jgi:hypothetical protein
VNIFSFLPPSLSKLYMNPSNTTTTTVYLPEVNSALSTQSGSASEKELALGYGLRPRGEIVTLETPVSSRAQYAKLPFCI